jgi:hypothetical protein
MLLKQWPDATVEVQERRVQMIKVARELFKANGRVQKARVVRSAAAAAGIDESVVRKNCKMVEKKAQKGSQERRLLREIALPLEPDELSQTQLPLEVRWGGVGWGGMVLPQQLDAPMRGAQAPSWLAKRFAHHAESDSESDWVSPAA